MKGKLGISMVFAILLSIVIGAVLFSLASPKQDSNVMAESAVSETETHEKLEIGNEVATKQDEISIENIVYDFAHLMRAANTQYVSLDDVRLDSFLTPCFAARGIANYEYDKSVDENGEYVFKGENIIFSTQYEIPVYDVDRNSKYFVAFPNLNKNSSIYGNYGIQCTYNNYYGENIKDFIWENDILYIPKTSFTEPYNEYDAEEGVYAIQLNYYFLDTSYFDGKENFDRDILVEVNDPTAREATIKTINIPNMFNTYFTIPDVVPEAGIDSMLIMVNGMLLPIAEEGYCVSGNDLVIKSPAAIVSSVNIVLDVNKNDGAEKETPNTQQSLWEKFLALFKTDYAHAADDDDDDEEIDFVEDKWPEDATPGVTMDNMNFLYDQPSWAPGDRSPVVLEGASKLFVGWRGKFQTGEWLNMGGQDPYHDHDGNNSTGYHPSSADRAKHARMNAEPTYLASVEALYGGKSYSGDGFGDTGASAARWALSSYCSGYDEFPSYTVVNGGNNDSTRNFTKNTKIKLYSGGNDSGTAISIISNDLDGEDGEKYPIDTSDGNGVSIFDWMLIYRNSLTKVKLKVAADDYSTWEKKPANLHVSGVGGGMLNMAFKLPTANPESGKRKINGLAESFVRFGPNRNSGNPDIRFVISSSDGINTGDFWMAATCAHSALTADDNDDVGNGSTIFVSCIGKSEDYVVLAFARPAFGKQSGFGVYKFSTGSKVKVMKDTTSTDDGIWARYNKQYDTLDDAEFSIYDSNAKTDENLVAEGITRNSDAVVVSTKSVWLTETKTPLGYKNAGTKKFVLEEIEKNENNEYPLLMEDEPVRVSIPFKKVDSRHTTKQGDATLKDATYRLTYSDGKQKVTATVTTKADGTVKNVTGLEDPDEDNKYHLGFTYEEGEFKVPMGTLKVKEISPSEGYLADPTEYTLTIEGTVDKDEDTKLTVTDDPEGSLYTKKSGIVSKELVQHGNIELQKRDETTLRKEPQGNGSFADITFNIINRSAAEVVGPDGDVYDPGEIVCSIKTNEDGYASTKKDYMEINGWTSWPSDEYADGTSEEWSGALAYGQYEVVEATSGEGYLLGTWDEDDSTEWHGFATTDGEYDERWLRPNGAAFMPSTETRWVSKDNALIKFDNEQSSPRNTVKRGDLELIKADDSFRTHQQPRTNADSVNADSQGNAILAGAIYAVVNRSQHYVVSPEDGETLVQPGGVVCHIATDNTGFAITKNSHYKNGVYVEGDDGWQKPEKWHGALAYGDYEVFEINAPVGYLLGHYERSGNADQITYYSLCTISDNFPESSRTSVLEGLSGNEAKTKYGFANTANNNTFIEGQTIAIAKPSDDADSTWVSDDRITVRFTKRGNSVPSDLRDYNNLGASWTEDTVKRGEIELIKADDSFRTYKKPRTVGQAATDSDSQGNATLEGAIFSVVNRSARAVVSPETGEVIQPGEVVCRIKTDSTGYASTAAGRALNGWELPNKWYGSLAYGDYEVFEIEAPVGYMLGHYNNDAVTYYSLRTVSDYSSNNSSVLEGITRNVAKATYGFANTDELRNTFKEGASIVKITPIASNERLIKVPSGYDTHPRQNIDDNRVMVSFTSHGPDPDEARLRDVGVLPEHWIEDTVQRGDIELIKADDTMRSYETPRTPDKMGDSQGNATLAGAVYSVVNRSWHAVLSPETGEVVQPGSVICRIKTDETGKASTRNAAANGWSIPEGWRAALPYGDYELFEVEAPVGYLLGHWHGIDVTYYSLCTDHGTSAQSNGTSLLNADMTNEQAVAFKFNGVANIYDKEYVNGWFYKANKNAHTTVKRHFPDESSHKWIDIDKTTVTFNTRSADIIDDIAGCWTEDTVKRADIELDKADDTLNTMPSDQVVNYAGRTDPQGDASLKDARFAIINRSNKAVVNPFGQLVQPGHIVCFVYTDENGHASTKLTEERMKINRWNQVTATAIDGRSYGANGTAQGGQGAIWAIAKGWHGALAFGEYELFEVEEPEGYLNGHWFNDTQTKWAGMAVVDGANSSMESIAGNEDFKQGFANDYAAEYARAYVNDSTNVEWYKIFAKGSHSWIEVDNFEWYKEQGCLAPYYPSLDNYVDEVQFTQDALLNGSTHTSSLDSYKSNPKVKEEQRFEDTVMRGNLDLQKVDEDFASLENGEILSTIEDKESITSNNPEMNGKNPITITNGRGHLEGAVFGVYNRSKTVVVSPVTGKEIQPGGLVCKLITNIYGYASTELTPDNIRYNEWDRQYINGIKDYANGTCWATENGWRGSLAYGQYEVIEITPPTGYLMNKTWHGMATKNVGEVDDAEANTRITAETEIHAERQSSNTAEIADKDVVLNNKREVKPNASKNWDASKHIWINQAGQEFDGKTAPPITREHRYTGLVNNVRTTYTNNSQATWINEDKVLVCFGTVQPDHYAQGASSQSNTMTENLNSSSVYADKVQGGPTESATKTDNDQVWIEDAIVRGGVKIGKIDRQNQQYKAQGKGSLENHVIGIFSTNPYPVTVYQMDEVNANFTNTDTLPNVTLTKNGQETTSDMTVNIVDPSVIPQKIEANAAGLYGSPYQDKRVDDKISWTYPGWIYRDKAVDYEEMSEYISLPFDHANSDSYFPGIYYYMPDQNVLPEFGKQTADGVFIGYITTREVIGEDGKVKYVASTDADTLPYGTYTLREMYVPTTTGYLFDEVSMSWHENFGIGDDFAYVEHDLNGKFNGNSNYYGYETANENMWYKDEMTDKNGWFWHATDYRFQDSYAKNNGANDATRGMNLYYYTNTSNDSNVFNSASSAYYLPGAYHNRYAESAEATANGIVSSTSGVPIDGDYFHRVVPSNAHNLDMSYKFVDFTEAGPELTNDEATNRFAISNYIRRGDIVIQKNIEDSNRLAGIPFLITSKTTGESHIVVTNGEGVYDSRQAEEYPIRAHTHHTNENDAGLMQRSAIGIPYLAFEDGMNGARTLESMNKSLAKFDDKGYWIDAESKTPTLDWDYGLWFYGRIDAPTIHAQIHATPRSIRDGGGEPVRDMQAEMNHNGYRGNEAVYIDNPPIKALNTEFVSTTGTTLFQSPLGALPYDDYIIHELQVPERTITKNNQTYTCPDTSGFIMISNNEFSIDHQKNADSTELVYSKWAGGILQTNFNSATNNDVALVDDLIITNLTLPTLSAEPKIGTTLSSSKWPEVNHSGTLSSDTVVYDHVTYTGLEPNHDYYLVGELHRAVSAENGTITDGGILQKVGPVKVSTGADTDGAWDVEFHFNTDDLGDANTVAFEYLYDIPDITEDTEPIAKHEDITDKDQTVSYPREIGTVLEGPGEAKEVSAEESITLTDTISYHGLTPGKTYIAVGTLMKISAEGEATEALDDNGNPIKSKDTPFTPTTTSGTAEVTFTFKAAGLSGEKLVAFEDVYEEKYGTRGELIADHKDPEDEDQTVYVPEIRTMAADAGTNTDVGLADGTVTIVDTVSYKNLTYGKKYKMTGVLMNRETGREYIDSTGKPCKSEQEFIAGGNEAEFDGIAHRVSGEMQIRFTLSEGSSLSGISLVVFETCSPLDDEDDDESSDSPENPTKPVAVHEDINDEAQTVDYPGVATNTTDRESGNHYGYVGDESTTIIDDDVDYINLIAGNNYTLEGTLYDKETGAPLVDASGKEVKNQMTFIAGEGQETEAGQRVNGRVRLSFQVPTELLMGKICVVFENLYYENKLIAVHADINDEAQTVKYPSIRTIAKFADGTKVSDTNGQEVLVDEVMFSNLEPGHEYRMVGVLHRQHEVDGQIYDDGIAVNSDQTPISSEMTFTPETENGVVQVPFVFDTHALANMRGVVFETLYTVPEADVPVEETGNIPGTVPEVVVARHEDITDDAQTVDFRAPLDDLIEVAPTPPSVVASMVATGDNVKWLLGIIGSIALLICLMFFVNRRRR